MLLSEVSNVTNRDCQTLNRLGRLYVNRGDRGAQLEAAVMLACTLTEQEKFVALFWWTEGVRDYAGSTLEVLRHVADIEYLAKQLDLQL